MKPLHWILIAAVALTPIYGGMGLLAYKVLKSPDAPAPVVPTQNLKALVADTDDRAYLVGFYRDFADVLKRDSRAITASGFRDWHAKAAELMNQGTNRLGKYPALRIAVSERITAAIGLEDGTLDAAKRAKLVDALAGISKDLGG